MPSWIKWILFGCSYTPFFLILLLREAAGDGGNLRFRLPWFAALLILVILITNGILYFQMQRAASAVNPDRNGEVEKVASKSLALAWAGPLLLGRPRFQNSHSASVSSEDHRRRS